MTVAMATIDCGLFRWPRAVNDASTALGIASAAGSRRWMTSRSLSVRMRRSLDVACCRFVRYSCDASMTCDAASVKMRPGGGAVGVGLTISTADTGNGFSAVWASVEGESPNRLRALRRLSTSSPIFFAASRSGLSNGFFPALSRMSMKPTRRPRAKSGVARRRSVP